MTVKDLEDLYDYGCWANKKLFQVIAQLAPEQFTQDVAGSYGSIRNTMVHVLSAEWGWLDRCGGQERGPRLNPTDYPTAESLMETWNRALLLRLLGYAPGNFDILLYYAEKRGVPA